MDLLLTLARIVLAGVFLLAAWAKLSDRAGARDGVAAFGVPITLARPVAQVLPWIELCLAAGLLWDDTAWAGALGSLALLLVFTAVIVVALARHRRPDCHCFGQLDTGPIGARTVVRNVVLLLIAGAVAWAGPSQPPLLGVLGGQIAPGGGAGSPSSLLGLIVAGAGIWLLFQLVQGQQRLLARLEAIEAVLRDGSLRVGGAASPFGSGSGASFGAAPGMPFGAATGPSYPATPYTNGSAALVPSGPASDALSFRLPGLAGETYTLDGLCAAGRLVLLLFMSPGCRPCTELLPEVARWQHELADRFTTVVISSGDVEANRAKYEPYGIWPVLLQPDFEVATRFGVAGTPGGVFVGTDGALASEVRTGADGIRSLVSALAAVPATAHGR